MKKQIVLLSFVGIGLANAQVGINTETPKATLDVTYETDITGKSQGVLFPTMTKEQRDAMSNPPQGLTIFNSSVPCLQVNLGEPSSPNWNCIGSTGDNSGVEGNTDGTPESPTVVIKGGERLFASIYDKDYLPYTIPTGSASFGAVAADGNNESIVIDYQGVIPVDGVDVLIPVEVSGGDVTLPAYTSEDLEISVDKTEDGQARSIVLSWEAQDLTIDSNYINAKLKSKTADLKIKKLDINGGVGSDAKGLLLGEFILPQMNGTTPEKYVIRVISGIPDRNFDVLTNNAYQHRFVYVPIQGPDGRIWLNNNLGADYANVDSPLFNPAQQAKGNTANEIKTDYHAYGSLFQWGREADGHELLTWSSGFSNAIIKNPSIAVGGWLYSPWSVATDPCPAGYHVPSANELLMLQNSFTDLNSGTGQDTAGDVFWIDITMRMVAAGDLQNWNGIYFSYAGERGYYWSRDSHNHSNAKSLLFGSEISEIGYSHKILGHSVRCIKD